LHFFLSDTGPKKGQTTVGALAAAWQLLPVAAGSLQSTHERAGAPLRDRHQDDDHDWPSSILATSRSAGDGGGGSTIAHVSSAHSPQAALAQSNSKIPVCTATKQAITNKQQRIAVVIPSPGGRSGSPASVRRRTPRRMCRGAYRRRRSNAHSIS
jgi:hypothetical protein